MHNLGPRSHKHLPRFLERQQQQDNFRRQLANGIPHNANACTYHASMLQALAIKEGNARATTVLPSAPGIFDETVTDAGASLFPLCLSCYENSTLTTCTCAPAILSTVCAFCEAARIDTLAELAVKRRTKALTIDGAAAVACECGKIVGGVDVARRCVGCHGIVMKPFCAMNGRQLDFVGGTMELLNKTQLPQKVGPIRMLAGSQHHGGEANGKARGGRKRRREVLEDEIDTAPRQIEGSAAPVLDISVMDAGGSPLMLPDDVDRLLHFNWQHDWEGRFTG